VSKWWCSSETSFATIRVVDISPSPAQRERGSCVRIGVWLGADLELFLEMGVTILRNS
jgi:hypothetical protein